MRRAKGTCMVCRAPRPVSHVLVCNTKGEPAGAVCSKHTLNEMIQHLDRGSWGFSVSVFRVKK